MEYVSFCAGARMVGLSAARIEQLIREPDSQFPRPFQPTPKGRRFFKAAELRDWLERRRVAYN